MRAAIFNLDSTILDSAILVFPLNHTHLPRLVSTIKKKKKLQHFPLHHLWQKNWHSFFWLNLIGSHLEFCHLGFSFCIVEFRHLVIFSQIHSKTLSLTLTLTQTNSICLKLIHSHSTWWGQPSWIWPSWIQESQFFLSNPLTLAKIGSHHLHKKTFTHSYSLNLLMTAILNFAMLYSDTAILYSASALWNSDTLLSSLRFTQKHSPSTPSTLPLTPTNSIWPQTHSFSLNLMMVAILYSAILKSTILESVILVSCLKLTHTCQDRFPPLAQKKNITHTSLPTICTKKTSLIHSQWTW